MARPALIDRLAQQPQGFGFFQAVRLLEHWLARRASPSGAARPLPLEAPKGSVRASSSQAVRERLRFINHVALDFPASEVASLRLSDEPGVPSQLAPAFIGLLGNSGALPLSYTELLMRHEQREKDGSLRAFYDWISHPAVATFYEAWKKHRLHVQYELDTRRQFLPLVLALAGLGEPGLRERVLGSEHGGVHDESLAFHAGMLQRRRVSAAELGPALSRHFGVPVLLESFVGAWYALPEEQTGRLGQRQMRLGQDTLLGERVWQRHLRVRLRVGPLTRQRYRDFLPGARATRALRSLLRLLIDPCMEVELQPVLRREDVQGARLGGEALLGWDSRLGHRPAAADQDDLRFTLGPAEARAA
ncbi:type VI secretion system baseplate subunit TssG [Roseateles flavus]|uniref:Type VI secretion system baseplate subunit TssG n=1 Tax=Roseateles flavus TaxID=3149041 RepID=A0ABV0G908_9BURK